MMRVGRAVCEPGARGQAQPWALPVLNAVQAREVAQQDLFDNVRANVARGVRTDGRGRDGFRITAEIDVVDKVTVKSLDVVDRVRAFRLLVSDEILDTLQVEVLMEGQGRQQEVGETAGSRFDALTSSIPIG